jgi:hypothetical protein
MEPVDGAGDASCSAFENWQPYPEPRMWHAFPLTMAHALMTLLQMAAEFT